MAIEPLKMAVIGVGHLGRWHVQQLQQIVNISLQGIYDADHSRAEQISEEFQVNIFDNPDELFRAVDAVSIVTPTTTHFEYAEKALAAGKHVFIEKPITETVEQGRRLVNLAREKRLKLQVGHIERFNPAILAMEGTLINPLFIESHRLASFNPRGTDVTVVMDLMIHDIDLILRFVKSPVKSIHASGIPIISKTIDIANCRLEFENGCVANVTASRISTKKMRKMRFFQPSAYISVDFSEGASEVYQLYNKEDANPDNQFSFSLKDIGEDHKDKEIRYRRFAKKDINPLNYELTLFATAVLQDRPEAVTGEEAVRDLQVAQDILEKIEIQTANVKHHWGL